jgi:glucose/arabinose dehydrogenase
MKLGISSLVACLIVLSLASMASAQLPEGIKSDLGPDVPAFKVRPGFKVTRALANHKLPGIRFIQLSEDGKTLYVSDGRAGVIFALTDPDANGEFQTVTTFVKDRPTVQGMYPHDGWLYFSQAGEGSISRAKSTKGDGVADKIEYVVQPGGMPKGGGHPFEALFVTDKNIYATASDPQNMTPPPGHPDQDQPDRKTIYMFDLDGKNRQVFCTGVRNNEKLRYRPGTTEIYGFDNGTDRFGNTFGETMGKNQPITDLNPPEECNHYVQGEFYGHPYIVGNKQVRPEYADRKDIIELADKTIPPEWCVHAHWAVLGFTFLTQDYFGPDFKGDCFFCSHGSWNSSTPVGACVQQLMFDQLTGKPFGSLTIVDCFDGKRRWARPVDAAEMPDGTVIFSSDEPPALYRISKSKE